MNRGINASSKKIERINGAFEPYESQTIPPRIGPRAAPKLLLVPCRPKIFPRCLGEIRLRKFCKIRPPVETMVISIIKSTENKNKFVVFIRKRVTMAPITLAMLMPR